VTAQPLGVCNPRLPASRPSLRGVDLADRRYRWGMFEILNRSREPLRIVGGEPQKTVTKPAESAPYQSRLVVMVDRKTTLRLRRPQTNRADIPLVREHRLVLLFGQIELPLQGNDALYGRVAGAAVAVCATATALSHERELRYPLRLLAAWAPLLCS